MKALHHLFLGLLPAALATTLSAANSVSVTPSSTIYAATASSFSVTVNLTYSAPLSALDITFTTPSASGAWKVPSVIGTNIPQTIPAPDDLGVGGLGFIYTTVPANAASFAFGLSYPAGMTGNKVVNYVAHLTDEATSVVSTVNGSFTLAATAAPTVGIGTQPASQTVTVGQGASFTVVASGAAPFTYAWKKEGSALANGGNISGATTATLTIANAQPTDVGTYSVVVTNVAGSVASQSVLLGLNVTAKVAGAGSEVGVDIVDGRTLNTYDQVLLTGTAATITADAAQITRISYIDLNDDIVQVEFSGAGSLTLSLENSSGPAVPAKYNQTVQYMKGHASLVISGANETTYVSVFSVGNITSANPALFPEGMTYDGMADIGLISITSPSGKFGGIRTANASYFRAAGQTGIYAPGVAIQGPTFVGDISAGTDATGVMIFGSTTDLRITGGDLQQLNNGPVQVRGITRVNFTAGTKSNGTTLPAQANKARLQQDGVDVTSQLVP